MNLFQFDRISQCGYCSLKHLRLLELQKWTGMQTTYVGIREAKIQLSKLLKNVQQGNEVVLTDRGKPVGKIIPIKTKELPLSARLKRMEEKGLVQELPANYYKKMPAPIPVADDLALKMLMEDREK